MGCEQSLNRFIICMAQKIATVYPTNCADEEDYIQVGHLKLAEIYGDKYKKRNFQAYAIIAVARAMRYAAMEAMFTISAPHKIKKQIYKIAIFLATGKTEQEICQELKITRNTLINLQSLINIESWHRLFEEPILNLEPFFMLDDLLSSDYLTEDDKIFVQAQFDDTTGNLGLSRKQRWTRTKNIRPKLIRSGYGN